MPEMSRRLLTISALVSVLWLSACGINPKDSGGGINFNQGYKGTVECLLPGSGCHTVDSSLTTWAASVHANLAATPGSQAMTDPDCRECHNPVEWDRNDSGILFSTGSLAGANSRPLVGCEGCHGSSSDHFAYTGTLYSGTGAPYGDSHYIPDQSLIADSVFGNKYHVNSCGPCHAPDQHAGGASAGNVLANQYAEWFGVDGTGVFLDDGHPDSFVVETKQGMMTSAVRGVPCVSCHTIEGFIRTQANSPPDTLSQAEIDRIVSETGDTDPADPDVIPGGAALAQVSCVSCHPSHQPGSLTRLATVDLCVTCHNVRGLQAAVGSGQAGTGALETPRHPQEELFEGVAETANDGYRGVETLPGFVAADSKHAGYASVPEGCVRCHYITVTDVDIGEFPQKATSGHAFRPRLETCLGSYGLGGCHAGSDFLLAGGSAPSYEDSTISGFDFGSIYYSVSGQPGADHDGDGKVEPFQNEVQGMLATLSARLKSRGAPYSESQGVFTLEDMASFAATVRAAAYNYDFVAEDSSLGMHNPIYVVNLLAVSISALP